MLSASFGIGAVVGALLIPRCLQRTSLNAVVTSCVLLWIVGALLIASAGYTAIALARGILHRRRLDGRLLEPVRRTQTSAPAWVRARAVAMNLIAVQASMALGARSGAALASLAGTPIALAAAAGTMLVLLAVNRRVRVEMGDEADVTPGMQLPDLAIALEPQPDDGPVLIQIEYRIDPRNASVPAGDPRRRSDPAPQRGERLARLPRPGRGRPLRRALHHPLVGRIRPAAHAHDDGGPARSRTGWRDCSARTCRFASRA